MAKMTMKNFEKSAADTKGGKEGKEGSPKELAADKKGLAAMNAKRKGKK
jgi:hypothetical protein